MDDLSAADCYEARRMSDTEFAAAGPSYDSELAAYAEAVAPVTQIPSHREIDAGVAPEGFAFRPPLPPAPEAPRFSVLRQLGSIFKELNPRGLAGGGAPALPLVVFGVIDVVSQWETLAFGVLLIFIRAEMNFDYRMLLTLVSLVNI